MSREGTIVQERAMKAESAISPERPDIITVLARDLREAAATLSPEEARYLVDTYYIWQEQRKRSANQVRALSESEEPHAILCWLEAQSRTIEGQIKAVLDRYSKASPVGEWSRSIMGIGPVIAAGLLAHIDILKAPTVGHIWRFAGLDPTSEWGKGQKRPWNARLKVICWHAGESFVKVAGRDGDVYGAAYQERKALELERNERGDFADQARAALEAKNYGKATEARKHYEAGHLPPAHIHARAKRWAVKLFLASWHEVAFFTAYDTMPPKPYILEHGSSHVHHHGAPNADSVPGLREAQAASGTRPLRGMLHPKATRTEPGAVAGHGTPSACT